MTVIQLKTETQRLLYKQSLVFSIKKKTQNTIRILSEMSQILNGKTNLIIPELNSDFVQKKIHSFIHRKLLFSLIKADKWMFLRKNTIILNSGRMANKLQHEEKQQKCVGIYCI